jgi:hypothetical protein
VQHCERAEDSLGELHGSYEKWNNDSLGACSLRVFCTSSAGVAVERSTRYGDEYSG